MPSSLSSDVFTGKSFLAAVVFVLSCAANPATAQESGAEGWSYCRFQGEDHTLGVTDVFRAPREPGWIETMREANPRRTSQLSCGVYPTEDKAALGRQQTIDFYADPSRYSVPWRVVNVAPPVPSGRVGAAAPKASQAPSSDKVVTTDPASSRAFDRQARKEQAQARVANLAQNPELIARGKDVQRRRAEARRKASARQAQAKPSEPSAVSAAPAQSSRSGGAMTFLLQVSVDTIINRMNGTCYSNLVTIPGPPGWPVLDHTNDRKAAAMVDAYKAGFLAQCSRAGPVRSGNFSYIWNARGSEGRLADEFARQQRNKMFQVQVSP